VTGEHDVAVVGAGAAAVVFAAAIAWLGRAVIPS